MPTRQRVQRYDSEEVQGEGSYVICSSLTLKQQRAVRKIKAEGADPEVEGVKILVTHTLEWNWVDDDGEPMSQPDGPEVIGQLTSDEAKFLNECIAGSEEQAKN